MLVLDRTAGQRIAIEVSGLPTIWVCVEKITGGIIAGAHVKVSIAAPAEVRIDREEVWIARAAHRQANRDPALIRKQ